MMVNIIMLILIIRICKYVYVNGGWTIEYATIITIQSKKPKPFIGAPPPQQR